MTRLLRLFVVILAAAFALAAPVSTVIAAPEQDVHENVHGHDAHEKVGAIPSVKQGLVTGITSILVFLVVAGILGAVVWPKIARGLDERNDKIRKEIAAAELAREQARDALETYEKNLAEARAEAQRMLNEAKARQQELAADLKKRADIELEQLRDRARRDIEAAKRAALAEIYEESASLATAIAGKILKREVSSDDQQRLVDESLAEFNAISSN